MDVNAHFNSQFVMVDFELLDNPEFMRFVGSTAFGVYLLLRRYVWRSQERVHSAGLHELYAGGLLTSAVSVATLGEKMTASVRSIKEATARLEDLGIVQSRATGREKIYLLGEWVDISEKKDGAVRKEWFYLERVFTGRGAEICTSEGHGAEEPSRGAESCTPAVHETAPDNIQENREDSNALEKTRKEPGHVEYVVNEILKVCGDEHSRPYYTRLAAQLPDDLIFRSLSEIRQDPTVRNRGALLVSKLGAAITRSPHLVQWNKGS
jgi:hypothetical protein